MKDSHPHGLRFVWHAVSPPLLWPRTLQPARFRACRRTLSKERISPRCWTPHGATFYDQNNQRKDPIAILKENGVNYVRLRLWVDPQSASGEDYGGGNKIWPPPALAKRAKARG